MKYYAYTNILKTIWDKACSLYSSGNTDWRTYFDDKESALLSSLGIRAHEVFDYVEDFLNFEEPDFATFVLIHHLRREYFLNVQNGITDTYIITADKLPEKTEELEGITWLPRIIAKAEGKLKGNLDPDIMFCCGGDRAFCKEHDIHPAEFLRIVWEHPGNPNAIAAWVKKRSAA